MRWFLALCLAGCSSSHSAPPAPVDAGDGTYWLDSHADVVAGSQTTDVISCMNASDKRIGGGCDVDGAAVLTQNTGTANSQECAASLAADRAGWLHAWIHCR